MARKLWEPRDPSKTNMSQFRKWVNTTRGLNLQTYRDLHSWSTARETADEFWVALFQYLRLKPSITPTRAVEKAVSLPSDAEESCLWQRLISGCNPYSMAVSSSRPRAGFPKSA